ncbi:MAG: hypothetical protein ACQGVC_25190 [Myxococcota bacterium]
MARPRRRTRPSVSLFPFLSILACVIGTLILVITASATSQVASGGIDLESYERLEAEIVEGRRRLAELQGLSTELDDLARSLAAERERRDALARERDALAGALARNVPDREALADDEARVAALERELAPLQRTNGEKREELARRRALQAEAPIRIQPSGSGLGLDPHFVECRSEGIVLYVGETREARPIPTHLVRASPEYARFLREVLFRSNASVIFLIREGGVESYRRARPVADRHRVRSGEMPIVGEGPLDFSPLSRRRGRG